MCARSFNRDVGGALLQANGRYAGSHMMPLWRMGIPGHMGTQVNRIEWVFADKSSRSWEAQQAGHRNKVTELEVPALCCPSFYSQRTSTMGSERKFELSQYLIFNPALTLSLCDVRWVMKNSCQK